MATENNQTTVESSIQKLFDAMDIIAAKQVKNLQFDKTVKCSITDDSKSDEGEYTVTDGSSTFKAYSESTKYSNGASVYVNIPNGDYNNRKLITGRYDQDRRDYVTDDPEKSYIDITQNLITNFDGEKGLIANGEKTQITLWDSGEHFGYKLEKKDDESNEDSGYKAYKKIFIKGKFKSWLTQKKVILGNYGIRVDILGKKENTTSQTSEDWYMFKLDSSNMIGDPYDFEVGFEQKLVFDLDPDINIDRVRVVFYQDANFYDKSKNLITPSAIEDIFVSEPFVSFGYSLDDFNEDTVLLYTFNSDKYAEYLTETVKNDIVAKDNNITLDDLNDTDLYKSKLDELNKKKIILRWVHETTGENEKQRSFSAISQTEDVPEEAIVHWYRYNLQEGVSDKIAGAYWVEMEDQRNKFEFTFSPETSKSFELFRVVIEYYSREYVNNVLIANDNSIIDIENKKEEERTDEEKETLENLKNSHLEKVHDYFSKDLKFENENEVPDANTIDLIKGLEITCDNADGGYNGVYRIYDDSGKIMSASESSKKRILTANYTSIVSGVEKLDTAEKIIWSIPLENTMIYTPTEGEEFAFYDKIGEVSQEDFNKKTEDYYIYLKTTKEYKKITTWTEKEEYYKRNKTKVSFKDGYLLITRYGVKPTAAAGTEEADSTQQYFRIKEYYTQSAINNTVYCTIVKNNRSYNASFEMVFGPCGTNGTDFTFTLEFDNKQPAITCTDDFVTIIPRIYDYQNKDVTDQYLNNISYSWYSSNGDYYDNHRKKDSEGKDIGGINAIEIGEVDKTTGAVTLTLNSHEMADLNYFILQGKVANALNIKDLKKYKKDDGKDKNVDGTVETDELTENVGSSSDKGVNISLFSYLPIPIRRTDEYTTFDGANKVSYNTSGVDPNYYKDPYIIYHYINNKTTMVQDINWMMSFGKDTRSSGTGATNLKYYPTLDSDHKLVVPTMFLQNNGKEVSVIGFSMGSSGLQFEWIQPLYIYQNVFTSSLLNSWDGSLTFDEENGTILSTMMGAGKKDSQNRFNGVLMGDLSPAFNTDEGISKLKDFYSGIGLYGFNEGQKSFGLNINGRAFFGKSGKGQILIDGNSGTIQSQHFLASMEKYYNEDETEPDDAQKAGMKIDLDNGILETYGLDSTAMIKIDPSAGGKGGKEGDGAYFVVRSSAGDNSDSDDELDIETEENNTKGTEIFYAGKKKYFLQSHNFTDRKKAGQVTNPDTGELEEGEISYGRGMKMDLMQGFLKAYDFSLQAMDSKTGASVKINSDGDRNPYFQIHAVSTDEDGNTLANDIIYMSNKFQRIRSLDFNRIKGSEAGTEIDLTKGSITSYDFHLKAFKDNQGIEISSDGSPFLNIAARENPDDLTSAQKTLVKISNTSSEKGGDFYLQSKNYDTKAETGIKIDLKNNSITAYDFKISASHVVIVDDKKTTFKLIIDSGADTTPLKIGTRFSVDWDGTVKTSYLEATGGTIGGWYIIAGAKDIDSGIYSFNPAVTGGSGIALLSKGEIRVGNILDYDIDHYMVYNEKTKKWETKTSKPSNYDQLKKDGLAYPIYSSKKPNEVGFYVNKFGKIIANGANLNEATINKATLNNCTINSANVGTLTGGTITGANISGSTISGATITGGSISGSTISADGMITCGGLKVGGKEYSNKSIDYTALDIMNGTRFLINSSSGFETQASTTGSGGGGGSSGKVTVGGSITDSTGKACNYDLYIYLSSAGAHTHSIPVIQCTRTGGTSGITSMHHKNLKMDVLAAELSKNDSD